MRCFWPPESQLVGFRLLHKTGADGCQGDVLADGHIGEEIEVLENHTHLTADLINVGFVIVDHSAVKGNYTGSRLFHHVQTTQESGFAGTGGTDNNHFFTGVDVLGDVIQHQVIAERLR